MTTTVTLDQKSMIGEVIEPRGEPTIVFLNGLVVKLLSKYVYTQDLCCFQLQL